MKDEKRRRPPITDLARMRIYLTEGWEIDEVTAETGWSADYARGLIDTIYAEDGRRILGMSSEQRYVDYCVRSSRNIRALQDLQEGLVDTKQGSAAIGAVKAQQEILDRMIKIGQELGFVEKRPDRKEILFAKLDDRALLRQLSLELEAAQRMVQVGGDTPFLEIRSGGEQDLFPAPAGRQDPEPEPARPAEPPPIVRRKAIPLHSGARTG